VPLRALLLLVAAAAAAFAGWTAVRAGGAVAPAADGPVTVAAVAIPMAELGAAPDRAIERRWLEGEAAARGLAPAPALAALRGQVADAVAGTGRPPAAGRLGASFEAFHARWRARTRCLPAFRDPAADRCGDAPPAAEGTCRWLGEATVCALAGRSWLVVRPRATGRPRTQRVHSHHRALVIARGLYVRARRERARAAAAERAATARAGRRRAAADQRAAAARDADARAAEAARAAAAQAARAQDPRLAGAALTAAQDACRRQARASEPYLFAFGLQDVAGQAEGLVAARSGLARRLRGAAGAAADRRRVAPLLTALATGNRELRLLGAAGVAGVGAAVEARVGRFEGRTHPGRAAARRLGLGDCLVRPAR